MHHWRCLTVAQNYPILWPILSCQFGLLPGSVFELRLFCSSKQRIIGCIGEPVRLTVPRPKLEMACLLDTVFQASWIWTCYVMSCFFWIWHPYIFQNFQFQLFVSSCHFWFPKKSWECSNWGVEPDTTTALGILAVALWRSQCDLTLECLGLVGFAKGLDDGSGFRVWVCFCLIFAYICMFHTFIKFTSWDLVVLFERDTSIYKRWMMYRWMA